MEGKKLYQFKNKQCKCPLQLTLSMITSKWKGLIIEFLLENNILRYGELKKKINEIEKITDKMLIQSLRELEQDGLIERKVYPVVPPKVEYKLTKEGLRLKPIIDALEAFGIAYEVKK